MDSHGYLRLCVLDIHMDISFGYIRIFYLDMHEYEWIYLDIFFGYTYGYDVWIYCMDSQG